MRSIFKGTLHYGKIPPFDDDWRILGAYGRNRNGATSPPFESAQLVVDIIESPPTKRTVTIVLPRSGLKGDADRQADEIKKFFLPLPYVQYTSVTPVVGEITNFITCSEKPLSCLDDLLYLPLFNIYTSGLVCLGTEDRPRHGFERPRDFANHFWQSAFNTDIFELVLKSIEYNELSDRLDFRSFYQLWTEGKVKFCPIPSENQHFIFKETIGKLNGL